MKVLVTGANGQLGFDVVHSLEQHKINCIGTTREELDITNESQTRDFILEYKPDAVIHCAAYTAVDKAEDETDICNLVNIQGTKNIVQACKELDCKMVYISTDYVFPGEGIHEYQTDDKTGPLNVYGKSKLAGEQVVAALLNKYFIVRVSWVFGTHGKNFVDTMLRIGKERDEVRVVDDQIGSPTFTADVASLLCEMIKTNKYGTYHVTNEGFCSFADFADKIFCFARYNTRVKRITTDEYKTKAIRPKNSRLSKQSLDNNGFPRLPTWEDALKRYILEQE